MTRTVFWLAVCAACFMAGATRLPWELWTEWKIGKRHE